MIKEEKLEPLARYFRFRQGISDINKNKDVIIADLGCGPAAYFYSFAHLNGIKIKNYIGIDPLLNTKQAPSEKNIKLIKKPLKNKIPLKDNSVDYVVGFAFLEHLDNPEDFIKESIRILKKGGKAIFTMPAKRAKFILDFLSKDLSLISSREIEEHKNYFDKKSLIDMLPKKYKKINANHKYFELGLNNLFIIEKLE